MQIEGLLETFVNPQQLMNAVNVDYDSMMFKEHSSPHSKILKECWQAATLGIGYQEYCEPCQIKVLNGTDFPDFKLSNNSNIYG